MIQNFNILKQTHMGYRAIIQLSSGEDVVFKSAASQISNLIKALDGNVGIELVCHGRSMQFVIKENNSNTAILDQLLAAKVRIVACMNMLHSNNKTPADLYDGIETVPAAVAELVVKQSEGWSYLKAGF